MTLSPDPIEIPGSVNVSIDATITADIEAPMALKLVVKKKEFGVFIEIPCIDNLGSWYVLSKAGFQAKSFPYCMLGHRNLCAIRQPRRLQQGTLL